MKKVVIPIFQNQDSTDLPLPSYATEQSSGMDLYAAIPGILRLQPGAWEMIPTGIRIALPPNCEAQIRSRSGLAAKEGVVVLNSPGTIDADYRGEIFVLLHNASPNVFLLKRGMKIAQLVIAPVLRAEWDKISPLEQTARGSGGFGSTGI